MATVVRDIVDFLTTNFPTETIRGGFLSDGADAPNRMVAVNEPLGEEPPAETFVGKGRGPKLNMELPNLQILCRDAPDSYENARQLADDVYQFLHNQVGITIGGTRYAVIEALQAPFNLGIDEQGRWIIGFNVRCWKRPN